MAQDREIAALESCYLNLNPLDRPAQLRVLEWLRNKLQAEEDQRLLASEQERKGRR